MGRAPHQDRLGEDLREPGFTGDDGHQLEVGVGRFAGEQVDEVVAQHAVLSPPAQQRRRGRHRAVGHADEGERLGRVGVFDGDGPSRLIVGSAADPDVPTEVDAHRAGAGGPQLGGHEVRSQSLADAAGVEPDAGRERHLVAVDRDVGAAGEQRAPPRRGVVGQLVEGPVVAGAHDVAQDGGIEGAAGEPPRLDRPPDEQHRVVAHDQAATGVDVQPGDLAAGDEAAPPSFELVDALASPLGQLGWTVDDDDVGVAAHGREAQLSTGGEARHGPLLVVGCRRACDARLGPP